MAAFKFDFKPIMKAVEAELEAITGLKVLWDPQPVRSAEPALRLTFIGTEEKGVGCTRVSFQLSLIGAGDGPDVFLPSLISASVNLDRAYNSCINRRQYVDIEAEGVRSRMCFEAGLTASGTFSQNENKVVETNQWSYLWTEPRYVALEIREQGE